MAKNRLIDELLKKAQRYCAKHGVSKGTLGNMIAKDARFFRRLEEGGDCTTEMYRRHVDFFDAEENAPPGFDPHVWIERNLRKEETA